MVLYFNKRDLVKFGEYLLSEERKELFKQHPGMKGHTLESRLASVNHSDIENWMEAQKKD